MLDNGALLKNMGASHIIIVPKITVHFEPLQSTAGQGMELLLFALYCGV